MSVACTTGTRPCRVAPAYDIVGRGVTLAACDRHLGTVVAKATRIAGAVTVTEREFTSQPVTEENA